MNPFVLLIPVICLVKLSIVEAMDNPIDKSIPLPKEGNVAGKVNLRAESVAAIWDAPESPVANTALEVLRTFAKGDAKTAKFTIKMRLTTNVESPSLRPLIERLRSVPNADQAYAIRSDSNGVLILANQPVGLLYGARTLRDIVDPPSVIKPKDHIELPLPDVVDWPDIAERGQWGWSLPKDLDWTARLKLNVIEENAQAAIDSEGRPIVKIDRYLFERAEALGVKIVPFIMHLEQISHYSDALKCSEILSTPDPSKPLPSDYVPGLCMSSPATGKVIQAWFSELAAIKHVTDIQVWLSEDKSQCYCDECKDKEPYELEVACIVGAFRQVQKNYPKLKLRLLLTQGSYPVNDKIIAATPEDVGLSYYDGGRTYDSSHNSMIYPLLEDYAKSGRWLGVYPQITHSWRTVFPWTAPQFIHFRANEFADKKLANVIGYAVPANDYHRFNVAAWAEWTWNSKGRSCEDFARRFCRLLPVTNCDPNTYARWALLVGDAGWALAESGLFPTSIYDPSLGLAGKVPFDHRFQSAGISNPAELDKALDQAREALKIARSTGNQDMIDESESVLAGLEAFAALRSASADLSGGNLDDAAKVRLSTALETLDVSADIIRKSVIRWGERIGGSHLPSRLLDTAFALLSTSDSFRTKAAALGVQDSHPELRQAKIGEWSAADFAAGPDAKLRLDVTEHIPASGGSYNIVFEYVDSNYGTDIRRVTLIEKLGDEQKSLYQSPDTPVRVSRWELIHEARLEAPARSPEAKILIELELKGLPKDAPADRRTCSGTVLLRKVGVNKS